MTWADWALDGTLALVLPLLAWRTLVTPDLHKAVVLFVALGFCSAVAWSRLAAPDVALVEAAVGAGLTGALLMRALAGVAPTPARSLPAYIRGWLASLLAALTVGGGWIVLGLPAQSVGMSDEVLANLPASGVTHPVTAVLLNFRGYDTLLEITVLLAAAAGVHSGRRAGPGRATLVPAQPLLAVLVRMLVPGCILVAGYLLWRGSHAPGGAFQSGVILGGAGILLILTETAPQPSASSLWVRWGLFVGPAVFLAMAAAPLFSGGHMLEHPRGWAGASTLAIEAALTLSIALVLTTFLGGAPPSSRTQSAAQLGGDP